MKMNILITVAASVLLAVACTGGHFIPDVSPTVTPYHNPEGTPSAPIVITPDLPDGWRWQFSRGFPIPGKDVWLLLDDQSEIIGAVGQAGGVGDNCWIVLGDDAPGVPPCHARDEVGRRAVEILVADRGNQPEPTATVEPTTPLDAFRVAFTPGTIPEYQVRQIGGGSFIWTASVYGSDLYQITECPAGTIAPPAGACVRGQLTNTTKYAMTEVRVLCDGNDDERIFPALTSDQMQPGASTSWLWVRSPITDPYSCEIMWASSQQ